MLYDVNKRSDYIDILKALAIFCVLVGHCGLTGAYLRQLIYSFHMPAFFIAYGLSYHYEVHLEHEFLTKQFIKKKIMRLLIPCFFWGIIYAQLNIKNMIYIIYGSQKCFYNAGSLSSLWFLPCMFCAVIIFGGIMKIVYKGNGKEKSIKKWLPDVSMIIIAVGAACVSSLMPKLVRGYPFSFDVSLMAFSFIVCGYILNKIIKAITILNEGKSVFYAILLLLSISVILITFRNNLSGITTSNIDMASGNYGNLILFFTDAVSGTTALICVSVLVLKIRVKVIKDILLWIGQNTFLIFVIHKPVVTGLANLVRKLEFSHWLFTFPICICTMAICIVISGLVKKYIPILNGA